MTTLAEINQTLQQQLSVMTEQGKSIERTSNSIESVKKNIASVLLQQKSDRLQAIEDKRELQKKEKSFAMPSGFLSGLGQGTGTSWLTGLIGGMFGGLFGRGSKLIGILTGALGFAAGKLLVWTVIGKLIASYFGDELLAFAEKIEEWTGIDLAQIIGENDALSLALETAGGFLALLLAKSLTKWTLQGGAKALSAIGAGLFGLGKADTPKASTGGRARSPRGSSAKPTTKPVKPAAKATPIRPGQATSGQLPKGFSLNKAGQVIRTGTGQFASTDEVIKAIEAGGKAAKYTKLIKFLGAAGTVTESLIDPAIAIYNDAPESEIRKQLVGSLGSIGGATLGAALGAGGVTAIPGVGQSGIANILGGIAGAVIGSLSGEWLVEELADFLMGTDVNKKPLPGMEGGAPNRRFAYDQERARQKAADKQAAIVDISRGDNPYAKMATGVIEPVTLQGRINAFNQYGVDRDRQRTSPAERGILPSISPTGAAMTQAAAMARSMTVVNNTPVINNITNNNGGGGATSIMTVPVATADTSDRRDIIRRYGR
jgi:hypothetical protein